MNKLLIFAIPNRERGERSRTGLNARIGFRELRNFRKFLSETFGQLEISLYFCTRKSEQTTEEFLVIARRIEIIDIQYTTKKVRKN